MNDDLPYPITIVDNGKVSTVLWKHGAASSILASATKTTIKVRPPSR